MDGYFPKSRCALQGDFMINGVRKVLEFRTRNSQHHLTFGAVLVDFRLLTFEMLPHVRVKANRSQPPQKSSRCPKSCGSKLELENRVCCVNVYDVQLHHLFMPPFIIAGWW